MKELVLVKTVRQIADSFAKAEASVRNIVQTIRPNAEEVALTNDLERELANELTLASSKGQVARSFAEDLKATFPFTNPYVFQTAASGLVAEVSWHGQNVEKRTGGDFGLVLVRPCVEVRGDRLTILSGRRNGILVQAKRKRPKRQWGRLTTKQQTLFATFRSYGCLLLYRFLDAGTLAPFQWQLLRRRRLRTVNTWLAEDRFPNCHGSVAFINMLGTGSIGTSSLKVIKDSIIARSTRTLVISIDWPNGKPPSANISIAFCPSFDTNTERTHVHLRTE